MKFCFTVKDLGLNDYDRSPRKHDDPRLVDKNTPIDINNAFEIAALIDRYLHYKGWASHKTGRFLEVHINESQSPAQSFEDWKHELEINFHR